MTFAWSQAAIPNLLISLFLCGLIARLWRLRRSQAGRDMLAATGAVAALTTFVALGLLTEGFDAVVSAAGLVVASGILPLAATLAMIAVTFRLDRLGSRPWIFSYRRGQRCISR